VATVATAAPAARRIPSPGALAIEDLRKVYAGDVLANDDISLRVEPGEVFGLLGPNGAGKTTLVNQIIGLLKPTGGTIHLGAHDLVADPNGARQLCSYLPQSRIPIDSLRVREAIDLVGRMRGAGPSEVRSRREELIARLEIEEWANTMGANVSGGVRRLVGFAMAVVVPRPLVILDEPTNDVDPMRRRLLWQELRRVAEGGSAVLLVTHNVQEASRAVDRLAIVDGGRVAAQGTPASLKAADRDSLRLEIVLEPGVAAPDVPAFVREPLIVGRRLFGTLREEAAPRAVTWVSDLTRQGIAEEYELGAATLEDTYLRLVGAERALDAAGIGEESAGG
jgi:ABC-2 type transport system ATP-binding protein